MVFLTRLEESIKARPWFAFHIQLTTQTTFHIFFYDLWISLNIFLNFFFFFLCQKLYKVFWFPNLVLSQKTKVCYIFSLSSPFAKKNSTRTNRLNSFGVFLLPFPKEKRTNRLNSFVSPFSLFKEFKRTQYENSFDSSLSLKQKISKD